MTHSLSLTTLLTIGGLVVAAPMAGAQPRDVSPGPTFGVTIATIGSGESDLGSDDTIRWTRSVLGADVQARTPGGLSYGANVTVGRTAFRFDTKFLGDRDLDIDEFTLAVPLSFSVGETGRVFVSPNLSSYGERGTDWHDSLSYGVIAGIGWRVSPTLFIGPGVGVSGSLRDDSDPSVFPILVLDWAFAPDWSLSTGGGFAATRGPGLRLAYKAGSDWEFGLEARLEEFEFALSDDGTVPEGVGKDRYTPVLLTARYAPREDVSISGFVGAAFGGTLTVYDEDGSEVFEEDYETTPLLGIAAALRF